MKTIDVAILGATGMVGQDYIHMLADHPYFRVKCVTGKESVGKRYGEAATWKGAQEIPPKYADLEVLPTDPKVVDADLVFSPLPTDIARTTEPLFAKAGFPLISDASAHRMEKDVPLIIPEVNPDHTALIKVQRKNRGWDGFIVTTPNCTTVGLALVLKPLYDKYSINKVIVTTMQAVSGAGFPGVPSLLIIENVIPYIKDEEEKVRIETLKLLGKFDGEKILDANLKIAASCNRVPTLDGHLESVYIESSDKIDVDDAIETLRSFRGEPQRLKLPTAPVQPIIVREEPDRPQPRLDRMAGSVAGMSVVVGRVRRGIDEHSLQLTLLSHNTIRGAAGTAILTAELLVAQGLV
ncbi:MAG: aspartate-semialdehyde dehydrogenase [Nitrososphaerota archaeon]|nr:aspartate-semialdehyde dehydrogenase [Nitrososphaerales archaeon]MDW8044171.1 aspartate-semialdehyde dehydrogenase [Nitrososphaerota archaeon]